MRTIVSTVAVLLGLAGSAWAQNGPPVPKPAPWPLYNKGVQWEESLEEARKKAEELGRPILFYQLVGDLKMEGT